MWRLPRPVGYEWGRTAHAGHPPRCGELTADSTAADPEQAEEEGPEMKVVIAGRANEQDVAALRAQNPGLELVVASRDALPAALADADGVYTLGLTTEQLKAAPKLRWVQSQGAGVEWIAKCPEVIDTDVVVTNTRGAHAQTIAEHAFAMLLNFTRGIDEQVANKREHRWGKPSRPLVGLSGMTMGVIGLGRIGSAIAQRAHGFDMHGGPGRQ